MAALEHAALWAERPIRGASRSNRLNPLPHAGTISVFLLGVVVLSGLYLTLFFEFGYGPSYESVAGMEAHAIQRVVRALHRYSSAALVLTTVVHGWRIFVAGRFSGRRRRWRWATGIASLATVWLAGVTGYWLVWDVRAQAITEVFAGLTSGFEWGATLAVRHLLVAGSTGGSGIGGRPGSAGSSGSTVLLVIWLAHLGLTAAVGWLAHRHLRRSQLSWLPPRHWMALMGGALLLVSLALPAGMLAPADPERLASGMPIDPFVLFLLPPLLSGHRWLAVGGALAALAAAVLLPRLIQRRDPAPVEIDDGACTGCGLCVADCPYLALRMEPAAGHDRSTAVVDPAACVGCGICLGSCAFGAMALPGYRSLERIDAGGRAVVIACDRHLTHGDRDLRLTGVDDPLLVPVRCAGMFNTQAVGSLVARGATGVQLVGCPPADCRYGMGNLLASERLAGARQPHVPRRWSGLVAEDWIAPTELRSALQAPGGHPSADSSNLPGGREVLVGAGLLVGLSVLGVGLATRAPFRPPADQAAIRVVVDHEPGRLIEGQAGPTGMAGEPVSLEVSVGGARLAATELSDGTGPAVGYVDVELAEGRADVEVVLVEGSSRTVLLADPVELAAGQRLVVEGRDTPPPPGAVEGRQVFDSRSGGACDVCHSVEAGHDGVGPSLAGVATRAADRVEGLDAEGYLRQSILLPDQYVVEGYPAGQMLPIYRDRLSTEDLDALVAYLLTLTRDGS
jgi:ferredoxin/mono/diheme cytochrome c family protein